MSDITTKPWYIDRKSGRAFATALRIACYRGSANVVSILLSQGVDPSAASQFSGLSCLASANIRAREDVAEELLAYGATLSSTDEEYLGWATGFQDDQLPFRHSICF